MRTLIIAAVVALPALAHADCCIVGSNNSITTCWGSCMTTLSSPDCDSNSKTPSESLDCKLDYWRKQLEDAQHRRDLADKDITKAQERIGAFTDAKRQK